MAHAYTPGLKASERTRYLVRRILPIAGKVVVQQGQRVAMQDVVAGTQLPGDVFPINLANLLSLQPGDVPKCMLKKVGDRVEVGEILARTPGIFGMFKTEYAAKSAGTIESVSNVTGQVILRGEPIPVEVRAFVTGDIVEVIESQGVVIETEATLIQGIFGIGGETYGKVRLCCENTRDPLTADRIPHDAAGCLLVGGARMTREAIQKAIELKASAIISGGIDDQDLKSLLGYDLGVAVTGTERIGITIIITEGFGEIAMADRTFQLLRGRNGAQGAVNGATQIRAGVLRPEIIIPHDDWKLSKDDVEGVHGGGTLEVGTPVRIIRDPWFGVLGEVSSLPSQPQLLESGSKARVLEVKCPDGQTRTVPRANVEIRGG